MEISPHQITALAKPGPQNTLGRKENQELRKACADFEALLTQQLLSAMRESTAETEGLFEKSYGEKMFQSMMDQELAEKMASGNGSGFGNMLFEQLSKNADK
ncbi:MAG: rod-binding protein [Proteobacteria bacterium]|nr:rod-binding protein [Pseudomonadota bacterium]MBU1639860.1 rod-binding protein [Pseudomonadota bacterium]